ncbi:MAG: class I SAM-dependent methyltransferase [Dehalococcoidales bacterium]|nr:MAG: class I SAM-dependent methyltransferase [Dehalococcoidales bacterium]
MNDEFANIAAYYDELYVKPEQYQREAARASVLIGTYKQSDGNELLDIACGTGGHISYWRDHYTVTGLDLSPVMLDHAIRKFPTVEFHLGDMVDFVLERRFDALVCLYGSIGFVRTLENLNKAVSNFAAHLKSGGILCLTPWSTQEEFQPNIVVDTVKHPHVRISRMENVKRKAPGLIEVDFHHLVGREGIVTYHTQSMEIGLFSRQQYLDAISNAQLELMEYYEGSDIPMSLFVARKLIHSR